MKSRFSTGGINVSADETYNYIHPYIDPKPLYLVKESQRMNKQKVVIKLLEERTSLDVKRIKLKCFIKSADFNNASEHQRRMLRLQQETMDVYSKILNNRIEDLLGDLYYETH